MENASGFYSEKNIAKQTNRNRFHLPSKCSKYMHTLWLQRCDRARLMIVSIHLFVCMVSAVTKILVYNRSSYWKTSSLNFKIFRKKSMERIDFSKQLVLVSVRFTEQNSTQPICKSFHHQQRSFCWKRPRDEVRGWCMFSMVLSKSHSD